MLNGRTSIKGWEGEKNSVDSLTLLFLRAETDMSNQGGRGSSEGEDNFKVAKAHGSPQRHPFGEYLIQSSELLSLSKSHCLVGMNRNY